MESKSITIALVDESSGYEATPQKVRLNVLADFVADVEKFLRGDNREIDPGQLDVAIRHGSLAIETAPVPTGAAVFRDLQRLAAGETMDALDKRRREVIEKWQKLAKGSRKLAVRIESAALPQKVLVTAGTDYHSDGADHWVDVERYVRGEIQDLGGLTKANAHVRLPDGKTLTVATDRELLRRQSVNRVYQTVMLRVKAKLNVLTGELAHARLIEFVEYAPQADEDLSELRRKGAASWQGIGDATQWVDELRGGESN